MLGMEDEDAEMAQAIAKSEEEEERQLQSELGRAGESGGMACVSVCVCGVQLYYQNWRLRLCALYEVWLFVYGDILIYLSHLPS